MKELDHESPGEKPLKRFHWFVAASIDRAEEIEDAPRLSGGGSRWLLEMNSNQLLKMPPPCAVESHVACYLFSGSAVSSQREPPRGKPVASQVG